MSEIRRRRKKGKSDQAKVNEGNQNVDSNLAVEENNENDIVRHRKWLYLSIVVGSFTALFVGVQYAGYMKQLHENDMWFSNIEVRLFS